MTSRRRFISILAGSAALPLMGQSAFATPTQWRGIAMGANAQIILHHPDAEELIKMAITEIDRLEAIFSLYRENSQLSILNRGGSLLAPAFEMVELLSISSAINARTNGAFDPTVQTLWMLYAETISAGSHPSESQILNALDATGWGNVSFSATQISLHNGAKLSLNGIAQGFIADKVTAVFRANGVENVLVNTGEISALGTTEDGQAWPVTIAGRTGQAVDLRNQSIATSAPKGTLFDAEGIYGHILDPRNGLPAARLQPLSVIDRSAAIADGLSTGFCLMSHAEINAAKGSAEVIFS